MIFPSFRCEAKGFRDIYLADELFSECIYATFRGENNKVAHLPPVVLVTT